MRVPGYLGCALAGALACIPFWMSRVEEISGYCAAKRRILPDWEMFDLARQRMAADSAATMTAFDLARFPPYLSRFSYPMEEGPRTFNVWRRTFTDEYIVRVSVRVSPTRFPTVFLDECGRGVEPDPWFGDYIHGPLPPDMSPPPP
jgi:hypothetical protein